MSNQQLEQTLLCYLLSNVKYTTTKWGGVLVAMDTSVPSGDLTEYNKLKETIIVWKWPI